MKPLQASAPIAQLHGGDLDNARRSYGEPAAGWLDLSTGINPDAYPVPDINTEVWQALPRSDQGTTLLAAARRAYAVPDNADLVAAPGTQILIQLVARLRDHPRVAIASPTYSEHATAWRLEGGELDHVSELNLQVADTHDVVVCVNPNNPTGRTWPAAPLLMLASVMAERGGLLVVDEAFADVHPARQLTAHCGHPGLLVLRSFGKFYGLAGLRLGFAVGAASEIGRLRAWLGPWAVSGPALTIGTAALKDSAWREQARGRIQSRCDGVVQLLEETGFELVGDAGLFITAAHPHARAIHTELATQGVWTRRFDYAPNWLRFGLPRTDDMDRLTSAIKQATKAT